MSDHLEKNRRAWDDRVKHSMLHTRTVEAKDLADPMASIDPSGWLGGDVRGKRVLCLASGGGLQSALFAAAGAEVTVVDLSPLMIEQDRKVAARHGLRLRAIEASMDDLPMLSDGEFDLVIQPVSTCYVPSVLSVYREVARVIRDGGIYVSQHKQPLNLQASPLPGTQGYAVVEPYFRSGPLPPHLGNHEYRERGATEFLHRWDQLLGDLCKSGFWIEDLAEPRHADHSAEPGSFPHRSHFIPPYFTVKAVRRPQTDDTGTRLIVPG